jgi:hypothetical protein
LRILKFAVNGQILKMDPKCDFENIVAGSKNYLVAQFNFNSEWDQYRKVARLRRIG